MVQGIDFCWGGYKNLVVGGESTGGNFSKCGGKEQIFSCWGRIPWNPRPSNFKANFLSDLKFYS